MSEVEVVKKMVPEILRVVGPQVVEATKPICDAITQYGCREQKAICTVVEKSVPEFANVSTQFFAYMSQILDLTERAINQSCEELLTGILEDKQLDIREKITLGIQIIEKRQEINHENQELQKDKIKIVGGVLLGVVVVGGSIYMLSKKDNMFSSLNKEWQRTKRTDMRMDMLKSIFGKK